MNHPGDMTYDRMRRRLARRAIWLSAVSIVVAMAVLYGMTGAPPPFYREIIGPAVASGKPCTRADLAAAPTAVMPDPQVLARAMVVRSEPAVEQLLPPTSAPEITATQAWGAMRSAGWPGPSSTGSARLMLGDLYTTVPSGDGSRQVFAGRLVWAIWATHQPERPTPPVAAGAPACYFESTVLYVDAASGRSLVGEIFPTPAPTGSAV